MPNKQQAPKIQYNGVKDRDSKKMGKAIRTHELEAAIMNGLGDRDMAMLKIMLFLTGNAEGFQVAEKTICDRCNISESGYKSARAKLIKKGWITLNPGKTITVNYDAIYNNGMGISENTPQILNKNSQGISENTSQGYSENTHNNIRNNIIIKPEEKKVEKTIKLLEDSNGNNGFKF